MKITLKQLQVFKNIHAEGQISRAAKKLHMSVPAASMALKELESALGGRLFERSANGLQLNPQGELLLPYANGMLASEQQIEQLFRASANGVCGTLTVGASKTAGNYVLSRRLPVFHQCFPATGIRLMIKDSSHLERMVSERELDLAFVDAKPSSVNLHCEPWLRDRICIVCGADNPLARELVDTERLSREVWYLDESATVSRVRAMQLLNSSGIVPSQTITMGTLGAIKRATATGYGVSILPYMAIDAELSRGDLVELDLQGWEFERNYWVIRRVEEALAPLPANFLEFMLNQSELGE
ncbi:LysR family transcriptional regulator [Shewanella halotolerans]|uniref:LysR family transcriptional regulator n=1 Tax=Shewanella halotolerans TaxID=2864204 RepID=UPI001C65F975|nr:LysR family transcriptional regulator [Shewanella halotolerans]QYJ91087.1 LysR family transcriptional regulator [Shewanella halotolerans]